MKCFIMRKFSSISKALFKRIILKLGRPYVVAGLTAMLFACTGDNAETSNTSESVSNSPKLKPNIIIVITDDQGYGDVGALGNPVLKTPSMDLLYRSSTRFTDFHVDPTCSPTRAALMTGKHSMDAGVWHTVMGRSILAAEHKTIAEYLRDQGYTTGIFGKWHLGGNYPHRPQDQGFDKVVIHGGGGVGQTPDAWGNTQFDDTYFVDGDLVAFEGNSTDIWFQQAESFIQNNSSQPTFTYLALNAPHSPWRAPEKYVQPYRELGIAEPLALFYAMITHVDERLGQLVSTIKSASGSRPYVLIFMSDNGSAFRFVEWQTGIDPKPIKDKMYELTPNGWEINAGMRGFKNSVYEGGHRVPFFISGTHIPEGKDVDYLAAHFDVLPTLLELIGADTSNLDIAGTSLVPAILGNQNDVDLNERTIVVTNQRVFNPSIDRPMSVMRGNWRYVIHAEDGKSELFNLASDPGQKVNVSAKHPNIVDELNAELRAWWIPFDKDLFPATHIPIGGDTPEPVRITAMDWMEAPDTSYVPWFPGFTYPVSAADPPAWVNRETEFEPLPWYLDVKTPGRYEFKLVVYDDNKQPPVDRDTAIIRIGDKRIVTRIASVDAYATFEIDLETGPVSASAWFENEGAEKAPLPVFYLYVRQL